MKKNITKPTGVDNFELLTAFKVEGNTYVIFDSERVGSMGLPIIYISNFSNGKLEKIDNNSEEWQNVKNYLKGIINGANFEYIKIDNNITGDEAFYTPLTLPQASFDLIKSRYSIKEEEISEVESKPLEPDTTVMDLVNEAVPNPEIKEESVIETEPIEPNKMPVIESAPQIDLNPVVPADPVAVEPIIENTPFEPVQPVVPVMPSVNAASNETIYREEPKPMPSVEPVLNPVSMPNVPPINPVIDPSIKEAPQTTNLNPINSVPIYREMPVAPTTPVASVSPVESIMPTMNTMQTPLYTEQQPPVVEEPLATTPIESLSSPVETLNNNTFNNDKDTFMKACENMFEALVAKYDKKLKDLEIRERNLFIKEQEVEQKIRNANEYLANAQARETVANIAHDNAQRVMDMNNVMPVNPTNIETGVI